MLCDVPHFGRCCFCLPLRIGILVFGYINAKRILHLKIYYYYSLATVVATLIIEIVDAADTFMGLWMLEVLSAFILGLKGGSYENRLHDFVNGQVQVDANEVYPATTQPKEIV
ncbi:unnamed protein product [Leptidea sinapis]|uniref:Uncharacterized protein n=1 Tax=Leptidea sinapis TaxID=189913 RepID=A0A5E4QSW1_9NEOP|nr:unnamed protein product [Leptidea sinapis]